MPNARPFEGRLPQRFADTAAARVMLLAIGLQESRFEHRFQVVQGKQGGGMVQGVRTHADTKAIAAQVYAARRGTDECRYRE